MRSNYDNQCILTASALNLECHHLNSWDSFPTQRSNVNNGVLLSKVIHKNFHKQYGYGKNTEAQFAEFGFCAFVLGRHSKTNGKKVRSSAAKLSETKSFYIKKK